MALRILNDLCESPFWDSNLTWYTDNPEFTPCFHKTAVVWIPCAVLWLFSPVQIVLMLKSQARTTSWTKLFLAKIVIVLSLNILCSAHLIYSFYDEKDSNIETLGHALKFATYILIIIQLMLGRTRSLQPSSLLQCYLFFAIISQTISFRWRINSAIAENAVADRITFTLQMVQYPLVIIMFVLSFLADKTTDINDKEPLIVNDSSTSKLSPEATASTLSSLTFSWLTDTIWRGWKTPLGPSDVFDLLHSENSLTVGERFEKFWKYSSTERSIPHEENEMEDLLSEKKIQKGIPSKNQNPSISSALLRTFGYLLFQTIFLRVVADVLLFGNPQFIRILIEFASNDEPLWKGILYASLLFLVNVVQCLISELSVRITIKLGLQLKSALIYTLYKKVLRISNTDRKKLTVGQIINTMAVDASKFDLLVKEMNSAWSSPFVIIIAFYFLWTEIGVATLAGLLVMALTMPLNTLIAKKTKILQEEMMKVKDKRLKIMSEVLNGIRVLKMYAWEKSFETLILELRRKEIAILRKMLYIQSVMRTLYVVMPILVSVSSFTLFVLMDKTHVLMPSKAFLCFVYFALLKVPFFTLLEVISKVIMVRVSIQRISKVLYSKEFEDYTLKRPIEEYDIIVQEASFVWRKGLKATLNEISFFIPKGSLVAIVGPVGCGKSSLLASLLREMDQVQGEVIMEGSVGYVPQQPWILNRSFRENILFLKQMDEKRYWEVIKACDLEVDLEMMPAYDRTEIGEEGIYLSGGQKQRVSLARAVYLNDEIYLLDDPLGAVDAHVGKRIFDQVISNKGLLQDKTRILVTNNLSVLPQVDQIFFMDNGRIVEKGSFTQIMDTDGAARYFLVNYMDKNTRNETKLENDEVRQWVKLVKDKTVLIKGEQPKNEKGKSHQIISAENKETGTVSLVVFRDYIVTFGAFWITVILASSISTNLFAVLSTYWLALWSEDTTTDDVLDTRRRDIRLTVYGALGFGQSFTWVLLVVVFAVATLRASLTLHSRMLSSIFHSPTRFFDTTPTRKVLNRFSTDIDIIDSDLPLFLRLCLNWMLEFIITIVGICIGIPAFIIPVIAGVFSIAFLQRCYVAVSRQLKRILLTRQSFVTSHFSTTLSGLTVIRACSASPRFMAECRNLIDNSGAVFYLNEMTASWLNIRLSLIGSFLLYCTAIFTSIGKGRLSPGVVGFLISNAHIIIQNIPRMVKCSIETATNSVSVERIHEYSNLPSEAPWENAKLQLPPSWPTEGRISFRQCSARYGKGLNLVLNGISFEIRSKEKVGIVGRAGAGKSSITMALFRLIELSSGQILIDDVDIGQVGLYDLRSRLTIIPRNPVLFSGSLRLNLDPFNKYSDHDIWSALEHSRLKTFVKSLEKGLDHEVTEGGNNLSVGQRQLVCLARSLLRNTNIIVLEEATASVDLETDDLIQATIRQEFSSSTVLTIAHRLNTIMDYDRVLVLDHGTVAEFDTPSSLLQREQSMFYSLVKSGDLVNRF